MRRQFSLQGCKMASGRMRGRTFDGTKPADDLKADWRQLSAATPFSASLPRNESLSKELVHFVHQVPGVLVGHAHIACGSRDRTERRDFFEEFYLSGTNSASMTDIDAKAQ